MAPREPSQARVDRLPLDRLPAGRVVEGRVPKGPAGGARPMKGGEFDRRETSETWPCLGGQDVSHPAFVLFFFWRWSSWTPPKTRCYEGFGLVDASGAFVSNRTSAVGCGLCQAGTASEQLIDAQGTTFQCKPCPPGYKQSDTSSTQCEPCPSGSFASSSGSATCNLCAQGTYQPDTAQTSCIPCSASQSTVLQGATSAADCVDSSTPNPTGSESFSDANKLVVGTLLLWSGLGTHVL